MQDIFACQEILSHTDPYQYIDKNLEISARKKIDSNRWLWDSVLAATGQPREMV